MQNEISIRFYRTKGNAKKLNRLAMEFAFHHTPFPVDDPAIVYLSQSDFTRFARFWELVKGKKDSAMFVCDEQVTEEHARSIINWIRCYSNRAFFADKKDYCCISPGVKELHGWGCKCLHSISRHGQFGVHNGLPWYRVGPFDGKIQFIDKQDIKEKLSAEADSKCLHLCPMFSLEQAFRFVDILPGQIDPKKDEGWQFKESENQYVGVCPAL